ncbi:SDR family NAD(P)-dependent oxidoreductase [Nocardioides rubriscoriae]|uniref:SDR family NAD(P)-dependent oxidoreductase n=1 Tax=Nocardioides rubriscoriae TaxID=642762 RepID=UPI001B86180D|nr:SDR family NAD(P)-dependent oxidoreductase [Nocardioides rubriscoriae]
MDLRWRTVVVTGAGTGLGREVALRFARVGAGVVAVDRDAAAADETAGFARACRVQAWSVQADVTRDDDLGLLAARLRDLGGADVLVDTVAAPTRLTQLFLDGLDQRRGRALEPGVVVHVASGAEAAGLVRLTSPRARVTCVVPGGAPASRVAVAVVDLARRGAAGAVVELG